MEQLKANIIAENMLSQVESEGHHYQVLTKVTYHNRYYISITNMDELIKSIIGKIHRKRKTRG